MPDSPEAVDPLLNLYREEYARMCKRCESLVDSSFDDFKMLTAVGALVAWPPLADVVLFKGGNAANAQNTENAGLILLMGFIGILFIITILGVRDALKWAIIQYYLQHMQVYEDEIRSRTGASNETLQFARNWENYRQKKYEPIFRRFSILFTLLLFLLPIGVLAQLADSYHAAMYLAAFVIALGIYLSAGLKLGWVSKTRE